MSAQPQPDTLVATRAPAPGVAGGCLICTFPVELIQKVNAIIWDGQRKRTRGYRLNGVRLLKQNGKDVAVRAISTHADHTEQTWRNVSGRQPAMRDEIPVYDTSFESVTDKVASLGMLAVDQLQSRVQSGDIDSRDLVGVARMGVGAVVERRKADDRSKRPQLTIQAIFASQAGFVPLPEGEVINVTPIAELQAEFAAERRLLMGDALDEAFEE